MLCFFPPLETGWRMWRGQSISDIHVAVPWGLATAAGNKVANCKLQAGRADLGICFISWQLYGLKHVLLSLEKPVVDSMSGAVSVHDMSGVGAAFKHAAWLISGWLRLSATAGAAGWLVANIFNGGLSEPLQGFFLGPCLWTVPSMFFNLSSFKADTADSLALIGTLRKCLRLGLRHKSITTALSRSTAKRTSHQKPC